MNRAATFVLLSALSRLACGMNAETQPPIPGDPRTTFLHALLRAPAIEAASLRASAAAERMGSSGRVPDPQLEVMGSRMVGPMKERSTMWEVTVSQPLPKWGERAADRERAQAVHAMAGADYALMAGEMASEVAMAIAEAAGADQRAGLLGEQVERLRSLLTAVEVRLSAGTNGRLADKLSLATRIAAMELMIEEEKQMAANAASQARGILGVAPNVALPDYAAPALTDVKVDETAEAVLATARAQEANAMVLMAQASSRPMTAVGVRFEQERTSMGDENTVGLAVMTDLPWRTRRYAAADLRAAKAEREAARADSATARHRLESALTRARRARALADTALRLSRETQERLNAEFDALMRSASAGNMAGSTLFEAVELLEKATETRLRAIQAETNARVAEAALWRHANVSLFQLHN
ncbi:MAG: TolC family protein [Opitutaceae bacterium]|nr:TolC family protein [Opitutaceae bacterium]